MPKRSKPEEERLKDWTQTSDFIRTMAVFGGCVGGAGVVGGTDESDLPQRLPRLCAACVRI